MKQFILFVGLCSAGTVYAQYPNVSSSPAPGVGIGVPIGVGNNFGDASLHIRAANNPQYGSGAGQQLLFLETDSAPGDNLRIMNASGTDDQIFSPDLMGTTFRDHTGSAITIGGNISTANDQGTSPVVRFRAMRDFVPRTSLETPAAGSAVVNRPIFQWLNYGTAHMTMTANGFLGVNTTAPSNRLHIVQATDPVRIQTLQYQTDADVVTIDANGVLHRRTVNFTGLPNLTCTTVNNLPRVGAGSSLVCSNLNDAGQTVGVFTSGNFTFVTSSSTGLLGAGTPASGSVRLEVNGVARAQSVFVTSDGKYKTNIQAIRNPLEIITRLEGKTYFWTEEAQKNLSADNGRHVGFIAQDLQKVLPELVMTDNHDNMAVNYQEVIPILVEAIKAQQKQIEAMQAQLDEVLPTTGQTTPEGEPVRVTLQGTDSPSLGQNIPNPFQSETRIPAYLPRQTQKAEIVFYANDGRILETVFVTDRGSVSVQVNSETLAAGIYSYTLFVDGKPIETRRMVKK